MLVSRFQADAVVIAKIAAHLALKFSWRFGWLLDQEENNNSKQSDLELFEASAHAKDVHDSSRRGALTGALVATTEKEKDFGSDFGFELETLNALVLGACRWTLLNELTRSLLALQAFLP